MSSIDLKTPVAFVRDSTGKPKAAPHVKLKKLRGTTVPEIVDEIRAQITKHFETKACGYDYSQAPDAIVVDTATWLKLVKVETRTRSHIDDEVVSENPPSGCDLIMRTCHTIRLIHSIEIDNESNVCGIYRTGTSWGRADTVVS